MDQHRSGLNQKKLDNCNSEGKAADFMETFTHASEGLFVIDPMFYCPLPVRLSLSLVICAISVPVIRIEKSTSVSSHGQIVPLSLQMYGCKVLQKVQSHYTFPRLMGENSFWCRLLMS